MLWRVHPKNLSPSVTGFLLDVQSFVHRLSPSEAHWKFIEELRQPLSGDLHLHRDAGLGFFRCLLAFLFGLGLVRPSHFTGNRHCDLPNSILRRVTTSQAASAPVTALNCGVTGAGGCAKSTNRDIHWQNCQV